MADAIGGVHFGLHPKQLLAFLTPANEVLYGGAAGGGKSHMMRVLAVFLCCNIPGLQVYLFRRTYPDLMANHMDGPTGFPSLMGEFIEHGQAQVLKDEIRFANGSKIKLCHCQHDQDVIKYQGAEIHLLLIDELTHFSEYIYRFLRGRVRLGGLEIPKAFKKQYPRLTLPRIVCGSNPGSLGHAWVKATFIDPQPPMRQWVTPDEEGGLTRQFIPALLEDNPTMQENDPDYEKRLAGLGSPDLVRAMRFGLWDIVAGAALEKLRTDKHRVRDFMPPSAWTKFMVIDWGTAKPFCVTWWTVAGDDTLLKAKYGHPEKVLPKGALICYREWYGWNGKPDEGCRMESPDVALEILRIEEEGEDGKIDYRVGDSAMWNQVDGPSVQERMMDATGGNFYMEKSRKDRYNNYQEVRARIEGDDGVPMLYIAESCTHGWRTLPSLMLDERKMENGPDTRQEDHWYDTLAYACASMPMVYDDRLRHQEVLDELRQQHKAPRFY